MICPKGKSGVLLMKCCYEKDEKTQRRLCLLPLWGDILTELKSRWALKRYYVK